MLYMGGMPGKHAQSTDFAVLFMILDFAIKFGYF